LQLIKGISFSLTAKIQINFVIQKYISIFVELWQRIKSYTFAVTVDKNQQSGLGNALVATNGTLSNK
jgi:hypothetical protein